MTLLLTALASFVLGVLAASLAYAWPLVSAMLEVLGWRKR